MRDWNSIACKLMYIAHTAYNRKTRDADLGISSSSHSMKDTLLEFSGK